MISIVVSFRQRAAQNTLLNRGVISLPFIRKLGCLVRFFPPGCSTVTPLSSVSLMRRRLIFASSISCVLLLSSCEPATQAKIEGGNPPVFSVWSGTGKLWMISITEYIDDKSLKPSQREHDLWRVDADGTESAQYPSTIGKITYGIVPRGYHQSVPSAGAPPSLTPGKNYSYFFASENGMPARGDFEIRNGTAVAAATIQPPCYYEEGGKEIEHPCM